MNLKQKCKRVGTTRFGLIEIAWGFLSTVEDIRDVEHTSYVKRLLDVFHAREPSHGLMLTVLRLVVGRLMTTRLIPNKIKDHDE